MKIVHLIAHLELGGAEVFVSNLIKYQASEGTCLELWCLERSTNKKFEDKVVQELEDNGIKVIILTEKKNKLKRLQNLIKNIKRFNPDIINSHLLHVTGYAILGKIFSGKYNLKIVETIHSTSLSKKIYHQVISNYLTSKTIAITQKVKENLINIARVKKNKIKIIENGIELPKEKFKVRKEVEKIICIGRLSPEKNHIFILKAYKLLKEKLESVPILEIYGKGVLEKELKEYIDKNKLQNDIKLMGSTLDVMKKLEESDLYIISSKYEGLSISLLEALGVGIPIIATKVPGLIDVLTNKEAALVELDNIEELSSTIKGLIKNHKKRQEYFKNSLELSKKYSLEKKAFEYSELYKGVLNEI